MTTAESTKTPDMQPNDVHELLSHIQKTLKAPKSRWNDFSKYHYRSAEDIQEAVKCLLPQGASLKARDRMVLIGDRYYLEAKAILKWKGKVETATAYAREPLSKKGMDDSQITGAASSYARKYAYNGLFSIDDSKDADSQEDGQPEAKQKEAKADNIAPAKDEEVNMVVREIRAAQTKEEFSEARSKAKAMKPRMSDYQRKFVAQEIEKRSEDFNA